MKSEQFNSRRERMIDAGLILVIASCPFALGVIACLIAHDFAPAVLA